MEYLSTSPHNSFTLKLPKCGEKRNILEYYSVTQAQLDIEEICINTLLASDGYLDQCKRNPSRKPDYDMYDTKNEAVQKLLFHHPFPRHQGPFQNDMAGLQYDCLFGSVKEEDKFTFNSYMTFLHKDNQPCKLWSLNSKTVPGEPKHVLTFNTDDVASGLELCGPASDLNMCIMYNCNKQKCIIMCPCTVCEAQDSTCKLKCGADPCKHCSVQCLKHHIDLPRKFDVRLDSFTIPCSTNQFSPMYDHIEYGDENHAGHRYAGIPRSCQQCRLDLLDHQIHHHVLHYRCKFCKVVLRTWKSDGTKKEKHEIKSVDNSTCSFCYKIFTSRANRMSHEKTEHGFITSQRVMEYSHWKSLECSICKCTFDDNIKLKYHSLKKHGVEIKQQTRPHCCQKCEKTYASKIALRFHELRHHSNETRLYSCHICTKNLSSEATLKRHIQIVHDITQDVLKCAECGQEFTRKDKLTRHKKEVHHVANVNHHYSENNSSNKRVHYIRPYQCIDCGETFKRKYNVERHRRVAHTMQTEAAEMNEEMENLECNECKKILRNKKSLKQHVLEAHGNTVYKCDLCEKTFKKQSNQNRHKMTIHGITTKLNCENCGRPFKREDNLLRHLDTCDVTN